MHTSIRGFPNAAVGSAKVDLCFAGRSRSRLSCPTSECSLELWAAVQSASKPQAPALAPAPLARLGRQSYDQIVRGPSAVHGAEQNRGDTLAADKTTLAAGACD